MKNGSESYKKKTNKQQKQKKYKTKHKLCNSFSSRLFSTIKEYTIVVAVGLWSFNDMPIAAKNNNNKIV